MTPSSLLKAELLLDESGEYGERFACVRKSLAAERKSETLLTVFDTLIQAYPNPLTAAQIVMTTSMPDFAVRHALRRLHKLLDGNGGVVMRKERDYFSKINYENLHRIALADERDENDQNPSNDDRADFHLKVLEGVRSDVDGICNVDEKILFSIENDFSSDSSVFLRNILIELDRARHTHEDGWLGSSFLCRILELNPRAGHHTTVLKRLLKLTESAEVRGLFGYYVERRKAPGYIIGTPGDRFEYRLVVSDAPMVRRKLTMRYNRSATVERTMPLSGFENVNDVREKLEGELGVKLDPAFAHQIDMPRLLERMRMVMDCSLPEAKIIQDVICVAAQGNAIAIKALKIMCDGICDRSAASVLAVVKTITKKYACELGFVIEGVSYGYVTAFSVTQESGTSKLRERHGEKSKLYDSKEMAVYSHALARRRLERVRQGNVRRPSGTEPYLSQRALDLLEKIVAVNEQGKSCHIATLADLTGHAFITIIKLLDEIDEVSTITGVHVIKKHGDRLDLALSKKTSIELNVNDDKTFVIREGHERYIEEIKQAVANGDLKRAEYLKAEFVRGNMGLVHSFCKKKYGTYDSDMVQAAVGGLYRATDKFEPHKGSFSTYAWWWIKQFVGRHVKKRKVVNPPVNSNSKKSRIISFSDPGRAEQTLEERLDASVHAESAPQSPYDAMSTAQTRERIRRALKSLPEKSREAYMLRYGIGRVDEMGQQEVGKSMGVSRSTIGNWLQEGREVLARSLEDINRG